MSQAKSAAETILVEFPYKIHQIRGPGGELIWVERGVNPDNVFDDKRRSDWPYSEVIADLICKQIVEGASLSEVCRRPGFPSYNIICRWKREHPIFEALLKYAYEDRVEFYLDKIQLLADSVTKSNLDEIKIKIEAFKWASRIDRPIKKHKATPHSYSIAT